MDSGDDGADGVMPPPRIFELEPPLTRLYCVVYQTDLLDDSKQNNAHCSTSPDDTSLYM